MQTDGERGGTLLSNMRIKTNRTGRMEAEKDGGELTSLHINGAFRCSSEAPMFRDSGHKYNKYIFFLCDDKHPDSVCWNDCERRCKDNESCVIGEPCVSVSTIWLFTAGPSGF